MDDAPPAEARTAPEKNPLATASFLWWLVVAVVVALLVGLCGALWDKITEGRDVAKGMSNCREIITMLRIASGDSSGCLPDAQFFVARGMDPYTGTPFQAAHTSNDVFHNLFMLGAVDNEMTFGCPRSPFKPDGNIGHKPDFAEAVKPGENHWAMTRGLSDSAAGFYPLVYENPAVATWPPKWNADAAGKAVPGRCWKDFKVIIGFNDSSVSMMPLESDKGEAVGLKPRPNGEPVFCAPIEGLSVRNVAK